MASKSQVATETSRCTRLVLVVMFVLMVGFVVFSFFPRYTWFYNSGVGLWIVAVVAGIASFFALSVRKGFTFAIGMSLGMAAFLLTHVT